MQLKEDFFLFLLKLDITNPAGQKLGKFVKIKALDQMGKLLKL